MNSLNNKSKTYISNKVGIPYDDLINMNSCDVDREIEKKMHGKKLKHRPSKYLEGRGNIYIYLNRLLNIGFINKKLARI